MSDEERPRKSWREIDRGRDRSQHRREEPKPAEGRKRGPGSQKSYRATLDRLFTTGKIGELVARKDPTAAGGEHGESTLKLLARIKSAVGRDAASDALDAYLAAGGSLAECADLELLEKALEHRERARQLESMQAIEALLEREQPKRKRGVVAQLKLIRDRGDDEELVAAAGRLLARLD